MGGTAKRKEIVLTTFSLADGGENDSTIKLARVTYEQAFHCSQLALLENNSDAFYLMSQHIYSVARALTEGSEHSSQNIRSIIQVINSKTCHTFKLRPDVDLSDLMQSFYSFAQPLYDEEDYKAAGENLRNHTKGQVAKLRMSYESGNFHQKSIDLVPNLNGLDLLELCLEEKACSTVTFCRALETTTLIDILKSYADNIEVSMRNLWFEKGSTGVRLFPSDLKNLSVLARCRSSSQAVAAFGSQKSSLERLASQQ